MKSCSTGYFKAENINPIPASATRKGSDILDTTDILKKAKQNRKELTARKAG